MAATGFGAGAQRWVSLLHAGTTAKVAFNGWHTQRFPVQSGVFQGSPLSPLLFALAVQPMSAHARQLAAQQGLHGLRFPDGQPPPFLHLHADDTIVHASSPADAQAILDGSVALHIDATGARLQRSKSSDMDISSLQHLVGPDPATAITFGAAGTSIRHLGIPLSTDPDLAATALYADILQRLRARIARWSGFRLSLLGRAHVAKQVLVAMFTYHGTFKLVPEQLLRQLCTSVYTRTSLSSRSHSTSMLLSRLLMKHRRSVSMLSGALGHPRHAQAALLPISHPDFRLESPNAAQSQRP